MAAAMSTVWSGAWAGRLSQRVAEYGFSSVHEMLLNRNGKTYDEVAAELGTNIAPAQLAIHHLQSCADEGCFVEGAAECLARALMSRLGEGWGVEVRADYRIASALAEWFADVSHTTQAEMTKADFEAVKRVLRDEVRPPHGWLPENGQDPLIQRAFQLVLQTQE